ncbi:MAG TPA: hypothetical protein DCE41_08595 [Cytophagales bacterium]|nr:hypothetical protein [Cytophagales bacterium]HAA19431.1 hypothetical protein [Cytophagales bacterium]HAP63742.1 hypothetical protein [Cytophagales bacterium]
MRLLSTLPQRPRRLFLLDGAGALLSAVLLGLVLPRLAETIGMPITALYLLAIFPVAFFLFDVASYFRQSTIKTNLKTIALGNSAYVVLSAILLIVHATSLTLWGWAYFLGELTIVLVLARWEWQVAQRLELS